MPLVFKNIRMRTTFPFTSGQLVAVLILLPTWNHKLETPKNMSAYPITCSELLTPLSEFLNSLSVFFPRYIFLVYLIFKKLFYKMFAIYTISFEDLDVFIGAYYKPIILVKKFRISSLKYYSIKKASNLYNR